VEEQEEEEAHSSWQQDLKAEVSANYVLAREVARVVDLHNPERGFQEGGGIEEEYDHEHEHDLDLDLDLDLEPEVQELNFEWH
jgi:hypothetical protein